MSIEENEKYNGFKNWETWALDLHLTNTQEINSLTIDFLKTELDGIKTSDTETCVIRTKEDIIYDLSEKLKDFVYDLVYENHDLESGNTDSLKDSITGLIQEALNGFLGEVEYSDIVENLLEDELKELDL